MGTRLEAGCQGRALGLNLRCHPVGQALPNTRACSPQSDPEPEPVKSPELGTVGASTSDPNEDFSPQGRAKLRTSTPYPPAPPLPPHSIFRDFRYAQKPEKENFFCPIQAAVPVLPLMYQLLESNSTNAFL